MKTRKKTDWNRCDRNAEGVKTTKIAHGENLLRKTASHTQSIRTQTSSFLWKTKHKHKYYWIPSFSFVVLFLLSVAAAATTLFASFFVRFRIVFGHLFQLGNDRTKNQVNKKTYRAFRSRKWVKTPTIKFKNELAVCSKIICFTSTGSSNVD